jgi:hypothetical protein
VYSTGDEFEAYWNEDEEEWMYLNAIRPDPNGPIYLAKAWSAKQAADTQAKRQGDDVSLGAPAVKRVKA